jgi:hypothetical protein
MEGMVNKALFGRPTFSLRMSQGLLYPREPADAGPSWPYRVRHLRTVTGVVPKCRAAGLIP